MFGAQPPRKESTESPFVHPYALGGYAQSPSPPVCLPRKACFAEFPLPLPLPSNVVHSAKALI